MENLLYKKALQFYVRLLILKSYTGN